MVKIQEMLHPDAIKKAALATWEQDKDIFAQAFQHIPGNQSIIILFEWDNDAQCKEINNTIVICLGSSWLNHTQEEKHFTLCHEIGHYVLGHTKITKNLGFSDGIKALINKEQYYAELRTQERDADLYAAQCGTAKDGISYFTKIHNEYVTTITDFFNNCCDIWQIIAKNDAIISQPEIAHYQEKIQQNNFDGKIFNQAMQQRVIDHLTIHDPSYTGDKANAKAYVTRQLSMYPINIMNTVTLILHLDPEHPTPFERITYLTQWQTDNAS